MLVDLTRTCMVVNDCHYKSWWTAKINRGQSCTRRFHVLYINTRELGGVKKPQNCQSCCQITQILKILKSFLLIQRTLYILTHPFQLLNTSDGLKNTVCVLFASVGRLGHNKQCLSCLAQGYAWNYICVKSSTRDKTWAQENNFIS